MLPLDLPQRPGPRPRTTPTNPHMQLDQNAPPPMQEALEQFMFSMPCVDRRPSVISVPGTEAMWLREECPAGDRTAFIMQREFAHLRPRDDGSLHLALPLEVARHAVERGWAELHPVSRRGLIPMTIVMLYGPRDASELELVQRLVRASFEFAHAGPRS